MVLASAIASTYGQAAERPLPLGLSKLHISSRGGSDLDGKQIVSGECRVELSNGRMPIPVNGWGKCEDEHPRPGDTLVTIRRTLGLVSVGCVPVIRGAGRRGTVERFSAGSKSRLTRYLSSALADYRYMGTLTLPGEWSRDGELFKRQLDRFFTWFMRQQKRRTEVGIDRDSICWFLEFQARGAPHVHFLYTSRVPWQDAARQWAEIIGDPSCWRTSTRFETVRHGRAGITSYARKYAGKTEQKVVPADYSHPGRFWGVRGYKECGTCHVTSTGKEGGRALHEEISRLLDDAVSSGLLRRVGWTRGEGFIYWPADRRANLYTIGIGDRIDMIMLRHCEEWT